MIRKTKGTTFFCFSPPVMLATFITEMALFGWVAVRYAWSATRNRLALGMLLCLAIFQLAEYNVCGRFSVDALTWSRIGFVAITLLPPLGIHLGYVLAGKAERQMVAAAYATSLIFVYLFVFSSVAFQSHVCAGNYAIFQLRSGIGGSYFVYYYGWLLYAIGYALQKAKGLSKLQQKPLYYLVAGYCFFLIPTTVANMVKPETIRGIPSVMCGFALSFALVLVFGILPQKLPKTGKAVSRK
jgi:hypothetical protein